MNRRIEPPHRTAASNVCLIVFCTTIVGCSVDAPTTSPSAPNVPAVAATTAMSSSEPATPRDIAALTMDLPPTPRTWETDDRALVDALRESGNRLFVAFKDSTALRVGETSRFEARDEWAPDIMAKKGTRAAMHAESARQGLKLLDSLGAKVVQYLDAIGGASVEIKPELAPVVRASPWVDYLEPETPSRMRSSGIAPFATGRRVYTSMFTQTVPWGVSAVRAPQAWSMSLGFGAKLLIVDTGHEQGHADLPYVHSGNCFSGGCADATPYPHGTWVSGVALSRDNGMGVIGVAPGVGGSSIYYWKACDNQLGLCNANVVRDALNWAASNLGSPGVINLSNSDPVSNPSLSNAVAAAWAAGHVIVASAGNDTSNTLHYPAAYSNVVGVSGLNQDSTFAGPSSQGSGCLHYSNYGTHVDLIAPFRVHTTDLGGGYVDRCGTSYSAPHVTGIVLLMRAAHPTWSNSFVVSRLIATAKDLGATGYDTYNGFGLPRADLAVGLTPPEITATKVGSNPRLAWPPVPAATSYKIYRRVSALTQPPWSYWASTSSTTYTDLSTNVLSFYGYNSLPGTNPAVSYYVVAVSDGIESLWTKFATFLPDGAPPE